MGMRQKRSRQDWESELRYIQGVLPEKDKAFNFDPGCFGRYVEMQARFAAEDGCEDLAIQMRERLVELDASTGFDQVETAGFSR